MILEVITPLLKTFILGFENAIEVYYPYRILYETPVRNISFLMLFIISKKFWIIYRFIISICGSIIYQTIRNITYECKRYCDTQSCDGKGTNVASVAYKKRITWPELGCNSSSKSRFIRIKWPYLTYILNLMIYKLYTFINLTILNGLS